MSTIDLPVSYAVDREQSSLRWVIPGLFLLSALVIGWLINLVVASSGFNVLAVLGGLIGAAAVAYVAERVLKPRWKSARMLAIDADGMRLLRHGQTEVAIGAGDAPQQLRWRFEINKRARIPKGWWMVAWGLETETRMLVVYTFMSPTQLQAFEQADDFTVLLGKKAREKAGVSTETLRAAGEERRLRAAEEVRWVAGAEMTLDDFRDAQAQARRLFPEWAPLP
jgi:hypothetical protein